MEGFERCLELRPDLPTVQARYRLLKQHFEKSATMPPAEHKIYKMKDSDLKPTMQEYNEPHGDDVIIRPIVESGELDSEAQIGDEDSASDTTEDSM